MNLAGSAAKLINKPLITNKPLIVMPLVLLHLI